MLYIFSVKKLLFKHLLDRLQRRSTTFHDKNRDSDKDDYQDRDYDVATLENNLSQAFRYGIYNNDDI
ncbi:SIT4 phosphatase-associated protein family [Vigna unguiculata]|uniref:SIT4 phosphatase-associated protein family n=1 Tax=Vigna unguiculata TaxID=3917 RepID=A0A4D6LN66_VIGUN|nr:SIT4 phosphatase-associated protein family [Vigna unguiculata]